MSDGFALTIIGRLSEDPRRIDLKNSTSVGREPRIKVVTRKFDRDGAPKAASQWIKMITFDTATPRSSCAATPWGTASR